MESMFRVFGGQHCRAMILWEGGLRSAAKILSDELAEEELARWFRLLLMNEKIQITPLFPGLLAWPGPGPGPGLGCL